MMALVDLSIILHGRDDAFSSLSSAAEALANVGRELDQEMVIETNRDGLYANGMKIIDLTKVEMIDWVMHVHFQPTASIILFAGLIMVVLPARATLTWNGLWPLFYCPPNDDRDPEFDPSPVFPCELHPA